MLRSSRDLDTRYTTGLIGGSACHHAPTVRTKRVRGSDGSSRQTGAALGATVLQHGAAAARAHPSAKTVLLGTAVGVGLKCTLHVVLLEDPAGCCAGSTRSDSARHGGARDLDLTRLRPRDRLRQPPRKCGIQQVLVPRAIVLCCDVHASPTVCPQLWTTVWNVRVAVPEVS